jgi:hypothetical protein
MLIRSLVRLALSLLSLLTFATPTVAHFGGEAFILVPADHVNPGEPFEVIVSDLTPGSPVVVEARRDGGSVRVGQVVSDTEGHFTAFATLPADYPHGYTELVATAQDGTQVSTYVHVGPRDAGTGAPPPAPGSSSGGGGIDPSLMVLGVLFGGSIGALGYMLVRRHQAPQVATPQNRMVARKRSRRRPT